jgi:hypothetical protein
LTVEILNAQIERSSKFEENPFTLVNTYATNQIKERC